MNQIEIVVSSAWTLAAVQNGQPQSVAAPGLPEAGAAPASTAQPGTTGAPAGGGVPPASPFGGSSMLWVFAAVMGFMILMQFMGSRKEKKRREALMSNLSKGDQVVTMGGIIGHVAEMGDDSVVIRLEDGRMRVSRAAIQSVVPSREHAKGGAGELEVKTASREKTTA